MAQNPNPNNTNPEQERLDIHRSVHGVRTNAGLIALGVLHSRVNLDTLPTTTDNTSIKAILDCFRDLQAMANEQISPKPGDCYDVRK